MEFIDALNQERQAAILAAEQLRAKKVVVEQARHQAEVDRFNIRNKRIEQAAQIRRESGVDILMTNFRAALSQEPGNGNLGDYPNDPDSIVDNVSLKLISSCGDNETGEGYYATVQAISVESRPDGTIVFWGGPDLLSTSQTPQANRPLLSFLRHLFVDNSKNAREEFARVPLSVPEATWRTNPAILEESLEKIYRNPYIKPYGSPPRPLDHAGNG